MAPALGLADEARLAVAAWKRRVEAQEQLLLQTIERREAAAAANAGVFTDPLSRARVGWRGFGRRGCGLPRQPTLGGVSWPWS